MNKTFFMWYACSLGLNFEWFSKGTHHLLKPQKNIKSFKLTLMNYVTQARCISFNPYDNQMNVMV